jgi:serine protease Do
MTPMARRAGSRSGGSTRTCAAYLILVLLCAAPAPGRAAPIEPNPLRPNEGDLLHSVDSATGSVLTIISIAPPPARPNPDAKQRRLIGTGVASSGHRIVATASMAIQGGTFLAVTRGGGERAARLRGVDRQSNLALFEVGGSELPTLNRAPPQSLAIGTWVAVIANVGIGRPQITLGRVIGRGERVDYPYSGEVLELDAPAYPGAAGGAVLNEEGEWVAVIVGRATPSPGDLRTAPGDATGVPQARQGDGILVALPVGQLDRIAADLESYGAVRRGYLGVRLLLREQQPDSVGVLVHSVLPGGPAEKAGIKPGDLILALEGEYVRSPEELTFRIRTMRPGEDASLTISRGPDILPVHVPLGAAVPSAVAAEGSGNAELQNLRRRLQRLEEETRAVKERIRSLEGRPEPDR